MPKMEIRAGNILYKCYTAVCILLTITMSGFWFYHFTLDESFFGVEFKEYYGSPDDIYPAMSMCFQNPYLSSITEDSRMASPESITNYLYGGNDFLNLSIDYENVTFRVEDYVLEYWTHWFNGSERYDLPADYKGKLAKTSFQGFWSGKFYKCYSIEITDKNIFATSISINATIFPQGIRPKFRKFLLALHQPNQILRPSITKQFLFDIERNSNFGYTMDMFPENVEVLKRRKNCFKNWRKYDNYVKEFFMEKVGCRPPYHESKTGRMDCDTKKQMRDIAEYLALSHDRKVLQPCKSMEKISYKYIELGSTDKGLGFEPGAFWVGLRKSETVFKVSSY